MINKITKESVGKELWDNILDDFEIVNEEHRRDSNYYCNALIDINSNWFEGDPALFGLWMSNQFINDYTYGCDISDITELVRVEKKTKTVVEEYYEEVK